MPRPLGGVVYSGLKPSPFGAVERSEMEGQYTALTDHSECGTFSFGVRYHVLPVKMGRQTVQTTRTISGVRLTDEFRLRMETS